MNRVGAQTGEARNASISRGEPPPRLRWTICAMLFAATSINYMDRQVIGLLKPTLQSSIGLTEVNYGYIVAAFQVAYTVGLLAAGRLVDRVGTRAGYLLFMALWSLAAMAHALARSVVGLGIARFFLGLGEAGNFPAAVKTVADWFPQDERSLATGIFNSGANLGAVVAPAIVPWVTLKFGWRGAFLATGLISLPWMAWWFKNYRAPSEHRRLTESGLHDISQEARLPASREIPWRKLLTYRQTWAFSIAKFLTDPIWWFYLFWLPSFFDSRFHLGLSHLGLPLIVVYNTSAIGSIGGGWLPAWFRRVPMDAAKARMCAMLVCAVMVLPVLAAGSLNSQWVAVGLVSVAAAAHQGWSANLFTIASDMFPGGAVGTVVGIGGMAGSIGGVLLSVGAGEILEVTHSYRVLFAISASAYLLSIAVLHLLVPGLKKLDFTS